MKNFKYMSLMVALLSVLTLSFTSCGDDDDVAAPSITPGEANIEGDEICVKAEINAPGRILSIIIEVTEANDGKTKAVVPVVDGKYLNVLNIPDFHKHIEIEGLGIVEGDELKLSVCDANGKVTTAKKTITAEDDGDEE